MKGLTCKTEVRIISSCTNNLQANNSQTNSLDVNKSFDDCCVTGML